MLHAAVPVAPVATNALWIQSASTLLIVGGLVLLILALPPVRRMAAKVTDSAVDLLMPRPKQSAKPAEQEQEESAGSDEKSQGKPDDYRREVEEFDLSLFDS